MKKKDICFLDMLGMELYSKNSDVLLIFKRSVMFLKQEIPCISRDIISVHQSIFSNTPV